jgi:hypothetical protein
VAPDEHTRHHREVIADQRHLGDAAGGEEDLVRIGDADLPIVEVKDLLGAGHPAEYVESGATMASGHPAGPTVSALPAFPRGPALGQESPPIQLDGQRPQD